jgi:hypothetical protein
VAKLLWEPMEIDAAGTNAASLPGWFRARLAHGWLVACMTEGRTLVGGRTVVPDPGYPACVSTTFVPLGPAPWN